jgi:flavin-dependent dehydrogenase
LGNIIIIGGGLAGLLSAIQLSRAGLQCLLIEKKEYPFHRVCGEYISNETLPFLKKMNLYPDVFDPVQINRFQLSSVWGKYATLPLDMGGFGISRYTFDNFLYQRASEAGVEFLLNTTVERVSFDKEKFTVKLPSRILEADIVIGSFGKRSKLDVQLGRDFVKKRSPYIGVKYHLETDHPQNLIALHNFEAGYCGISNIESGKTNLCYLSHRNNLKKFGDIKTMEEHVLYKNPLLKSIFKNSTFLFQKPEVINEISFETKNPVEQHILMAGDAAGMITPLCGNGMAMAMHASKILSELIILFCNKKINRSELEQHYTRDWTKHFAKRLWLGRQVQRLFGNETTSSMLVSVILRSRFLAKQIVRNTHGKLF